MQLCYTTSEIGKAYYWRKTKVIAVSMIFLTESWLGSTGLFEVTGVMVIIE